MSDTSDDAETEEPTDPRSRLPTMGGRRNLEMDAIGWLIFAGILIVLIPLLPAILLAVLLSKLLGFTGRKRLSWPRSVP